MVNYNKIAIAEEIESNKEILVVQIAKDTDLSKVKLTLHPDKFNKLSSLSPLTEEEYIEAVEEAIESEMDEWTDLKLKGQMQLVYEKALIRSMLKYAVKEEIIKEEYINQQAGLEVSYSSAYNLNEQYIGDSVTVSIVFMNV